VSLQAARFSTSSCFCITKFPDVTKVLIRGSIPDASLTQNRDRSVVIEVVRNGGKLQEKLPSPQ
jgi:hypothetical protein